MKGKKTIVLFLILCFLTVLIVVGSVLFSVNTIVGYCYNSEDADLKQSVEDAAHAKLSIGDNIFLIHESEIIDSIESAIANVKVINIERKFPSSVYVNYIKLEEYFTVFYENTYMNVSNDCKILSKSDVPSSDKRIGLLFKQRPDSVNVGDRLFNDRSGICEIISDVMISLSRVATYDKLMDMIDKVDLRYLDSELLYIKTVAGVSMEIQRPDMYLFDKLICALSYLDRAELSHKSAGTIIVAHSGKEMICAYSPEDRYGNRNLS